MSSDTTEQSRQAADNDGPPLDEQLRRQLEPLDFSPSSTATQPSDAAQDTTEGMKTGRHAYTENATFAVEDIDAPSNDDVRPTLPEVWDVDEDGASPYGSLNELNRSVFTNEDTNKGSEQDKQDYRNDAQTWGRHIGLTNHEIQRAIFLVDRAEKGYMNNHGATTIILAALTLAANETNGSSDTAKAIRPEHALASKTPDLVDNYTSLRDDLDVSRQGVRTCRNHLRQFM